MDIFDTFTITPAAFIGYLFIVMVIGYAFGKLDADGR